MSRRTAPRGFSLIELLIVVGILLVIAAIAIPSFMRSRIRANEGSTVASLRAINTAAATYATLYANGYPPLLTVLGPDPGGGGPTCDNANLIDSVLAAGNKSGYTITYTPGVARGAPATACTNPGVDDYTINADPNAPGSTGDRYFFTDNSGAIRFNTTQPAGPADPAVN